MSIQTNPPVVRRNDTDITLVQAAFGKKSPNNAGKNFWAIPVTAENWETIQKWAGLTELIKVASRFFTKVSADASLDPTNYNPDGTLNIDNFVSALADFTAGRVTLSDIDAEIDELLDLQQTYLTDPIWLSYELGQPLNEAQFATKGKLQEVGKKINDLRKQQETIEAIYKARAAKRAANAEASSTKTPA